MGMNFPHVSCISCYDISVVIVETEYPSRHVNQNSICISGWQMVIKIFCGVRFNVGYGSLVSREVFLFSELFGLALGPSHYPVQWILRASSLGLMQPLCLLLSLRMHGPKPPLWYVFVTWWLIKQRNSLIILTNLCWGYKGVSVFPVIYSSSHWCSLFYQRYLSLCIQLSTKS